MSATVVNGLFTGTVAVWGGVSPGQAVTGVCLVPNTLNVPVNYTAASISGPGAAFWSVVAGQFPVTVNPGQTALIQLKFLDNTPSDADNATLTVTTSNVNFSPTITLQATTTASPPPAANGDMFPSNLVVYPATKVGQTTSLAQFAIVNAYNASLRVNNIALTVGTDFAIVGAPVVPFTIAQGAQSALFTISFTPTTTGTRQDTLTVTSDDGAGGHTGGNILLLQGVGSTLQSAFNLTGATQGMVFAFPNAGAPLVLIANPTNFNTEEASSLVKLHDFGMVNTEKEWLRIRGHYEDLGQANVTFQLRARRIGQSDEIIPVTVAIGTVAADGWIREFTSEPTPVTGELIQITISRVALGGPVSIIDYVPCFEPKGEVIGGT